MQCSALQFLLSVAHCIDWYGVLAVMIALIVIIYRTPRQPTQSRATELYGIELKCSVLSCSVFN